MRRLTWALLVAFAFCVPWAYSLDIGEPYGNIARILGLMVVAAAVPAILVSGRVRTPGALQWLVLALFFWFCCTSLWSIDEHATLARLRAYLQVMMPVWLVWEFAEGEPDLRDLLRALVAGSWVLAALTIVSFVSADSALQIRFAAEGHDPNDAARFLDVGFPLSALLADREREWPWRVLAIGFFPMGIGGVLLTASRSGFLAAVVALMGCAILLLRRQAWTVIAGAASLPAAAAALWFLVPHGTILRIATIPEQLQRGDLNQRLNIWSAGWQAFIRAPFFGSGAGAFVSAARLAPVDTAHNSALTFAVEGGVVALILASAIVAVCLRLVLVTRGSLRIAFATAFLVWFVASLTATVEGNRTTWLLVGMLSLAGRLAAREPEVTDAWPAGRAPERSQALAGEIP